MSDAVDSASVSAALEARIAEADSAINNTESDATAETEPVSTEPEAKESESDSQEEVSSEGSEEVEFNFKDTPTSTQGLVNKLSKLSEADRALEIEKRVSNKATRQTELNALKESFPESFKEEATISKSEYDALAKKIEKLESLENLESTQELLAKLEDNQASCRNGITKPNAQGTTWRGVQRRPKRCKVFRRFW